MKPHRILIAGGGSGGHFFPALAIAQALQRLRPQTQVRFGGSSYGLERQLAPQAGYRVHLVAIRGWSGMGFLRRLHTLALLPLACLQCLRALLGYRPQLIIGVGGYASTPFAALGLLLGRKVALQEQNAYPGLANRLLGPFAHAAFLPDGQQQRFFRRGIVTGAPVRQEILALRQQAPPGPGRPPCLLVLGGSQGARALNAAVVEALPCLARWGGGLRIIHQTGAADLAWVRRQQARQAGLRAEAHAFIHDMPAAYARAHLVYGRAGASAIQELSCARKPAVLTPIPHSSGNHQLQNARRCAEAQAAILLEQHALDGKTLAQTLISLLEDPQRLAHMADRAGALFHGDAAAEIARLAFLLLDHGAGALPSA